MNIDSHCRTDPNTAIAAIERIRTSSQERRKARRFWWPWAEALALLSGWAGLGLIMWVLHEIFS